MEWAKGWSYGYTTTTHSTQPEISRAVGRRRLRDDDRADCDAHRLLILPDERTRRHEVARRRPQDVVGGPVTVFERRVLTYTPSNPAPFKVEMGNVGQHYLAWRYGG